MDERVVRLCASGDLPEGGDGLRFPLGDSLGGFAVRFAGVVHAYVNRCPHQGTELDWQPGEFFTEDGAYLVCATHGAIFQPHDGRCVAGPCRGASLQALRVRERNGEVLFYNDGVSRQDARESDEP